MLGFIGFLFLVEQITVSVLFERMLILGRNGEKCRKSPAYCFFQESVGIISPTCVVCLKCIGLVRVKCLLG